MKLLSHYFTSLVFLTTTTPLRSLALSIPAHLTKPVTKHAWVQIPQGWEEHTSAPSADQPITLRIALKQSGIEELVSALYEVSDPESERYGRHLSKG
jgi:tripeptidyl-peptidase-1